MKVLVTGSAGFIGSRVAGLLLARGDEVVGVDNFNDYYDVSLKRARQARLLEGRGYRDVELDVADTVGMTNLFADGQFDGVVHLAAQASVRYSIEAPQSYVDSNVTGTLNVLEGCRYNEVSHLVYASTSSVFGANTQMPFSVQQPADHPLAIYAATKRCGELMAHSYSHLFGLPTTGLRFFTVYGPWGRPDMALFSFTKKILAGESIPVFNHGKHTRDFTYIDDIAKGIMAALDKPAESDPEWDSNNPSSHTSYAPWRIYNIGNHAPVQLLHYIEVLEECLGKSAQKEMLPMQPGDVPDTYADVTELIHNVGYKPETSVEYGVEQFVRWYRDYYQV